MIISQKYNINKQFLKYAKKFLDFSQEIDIEKWEAKMADSNFYNQSDADAQIAKYKKVEADLERVMEEWEEAQMKLEEFLENL